MTDSITATEAMMNATSDAREERILHERMTWFFDKYMAKLRSDEAAEFHADFHMIVRDIYRDASRDAQALLARSLAAMPPSQFIIKQDK